MKTRPFFNNGCQLIFIKRCLNAKRFHLDPGWLQNPMSENTSSLKLKGFNQVEVTPQANQVLIERLIDFGLYPGVEFEIINKIALSNVTVIRFHQTLLALNEQEFKCLAT